MGLTENPSSWLVSTPEVARIIGEFNASVEKKKKIDHYRHHEQTQHMTFM